MPLPAEAELCLYLLRMFNTSKSAFRVLIIVSLLRSWWWDLGVGGYYAFTGVTGVVAIFMGINCLGTALSATTIGLDLIIISDILSHEIAPRKDRWMKSVLAMLSTVMLCVRVWDSSRKKTSLYEIRSRWLSIPSSLQGLKLYVIPSLEPVGPPTTNLLSYFCRCCLETQDSLSNLSGAWPFYECDTTF